MGFLSFSRLTGKWDASPSHRQTVGVLLESLRVGVRGVRGVRTTRSVALVLLVLVAFTGCATAPVPAERPERQVAEAPQWLAPVTMGLSVLLGYLAAQRNR